MTFLLFLIYIYLPLLTDKTYIIVKKLFKVKTTIFSSDLKSGSVVYSEANIYIYEILK